MAAAGKAPRWRPGQAVERGLVDGPDEDRRTILEAIANGERGPRALAALAAAQVKGGRAAIERSLNGMMIGAHHPMLIRAHLDHHTLLDRTVAAIEDDIEAALGAIPAARGISADGVPSARPGPDAAALPVAERLAEIPGVSLMIARAIIAETGLDIARFPTAACHGASAGPGPGAPSNAPSTSSSGTFSPTPKPGSPTSAPTGTHATATGTGKSRPTSGSSASMSPSPRQPPESQNRR